MESCKCTHSSTSQPPLEWPELLSLIPHRLPTHNMMFFTLTFFSSCGGTLMCRPETEDWPRRICLALKSMRLSNSLSAILAKKYKKPYPAGQTLNFCFWALNIQIYSWQNVNLNLFYFTLMYLDQLRLRTRLLKLLLENPSMVTVYMIYFECLIWTSHQAE